MSAGGLRYALVGVLALLGTLRTAASADLLQGSVALTSDYLVRGISRSANDPALQLDVHYVADSGLLAGAFASNTRIDPQHAWTAELSAYLGLAWSVGSDWRGKALAAYYAYPSTGSGEPSYNYGEIDLDWYYEQWADLSFSYSPAAPRLGRYAALQRVAAESGEVDFQAPVHGRLAGTAGVGYQHYAGENPVGFVYWSVGLTYDLAPLSLSLSYADTGIAAEQVFYGNASRGRWIATVIVRF